MQKIIYLRNYRQSNVIKNVTQFKRNEVRRSTALIFTELIYA